MMLCRACGGTTHPVFAMRPMPLAGALFPSRAQAMAAPRYELEWRECARCTAINTSPDIPDHELYSRYHYRSSSVPAVVAHHEGFARFLTTRFPAKAGVRILEIGCNDGVLLERLPKLWDRVGVDPSDVAAHAAQGAGYGFLPLPFGSEVARALGRFQLVVSSNAWAHFNSIGDAFAGAALALAPGGELWLEVHDLDATLAQADWTSIYHEHKLEWSEDALVAAAGLHGLVPIAVMRLPLHRGLLRVGFRRGMAPAFEPVRRMFAGLRHRYSSATAPELPDGSLAYGAGGRGAVYLAQLEPNVRAVVDASPARQGFWMAGTGLPVWAPELFGDPPAVLITAIGMEADVMASHPGYSGWRQVAL